MTNAETDVAAVLDALRAEVRARRVAEAEGQAGTPLSAIERELHRAAEQLEITRVVSAHWPLEGRSLYERGWLLVHKLVRRYLRWYINPIVEQQNAFNDVGARSIRLLIEANAELRDQLADLRRQREQVPPPGPPPGPPPPAPVDDAPPTAHLQRLVERGAGAEPAAALPDLALRPLPARAAERAAVSAHWDLPNDTPLVRARSLAQKGVRQYLRWMINPIVEQQNGANAAIADALPHLIAADAELRAQVAALRAQR
ncbi:hypothetical protein K2Z83_04430 [Oscillochloris sp. ZM17-4]|uniref:hypothetical protein n=1 Tax=Oscillochloris sp. ZM17-4 TaxID=2866714 RepID=UPI001C731288|nr:hypothetical protein [Oscillochloris sp. ZM17-4]MBX0326929.1 hypothetical protein [Oscillochloris sp. ZM17-4]